MEFYGFESLIDNNLDKHFAYNYGIKGRGYPWPHWQDTLEFQYFFKDGFVFLDGVRYDIPAGSIVAINPYVVHSIDEARGGDVFHATFIIDKEFFSYIDFSKIQIEPVINDEECIRLYEDILASDTEKTYSDAAIRGKIFIFVAKLAREHSVPRNDTNNKISIMQAFSYISDNLEKSITLDSLADICNMSKYHFCRVFKQITRCTVVEYINILRCSKAAMLIRKKGYSVNQAARECGYKNMSYFARSFKKIRGYLPENDKNGSDN